MDIDVILASSGHPVDEDEEEVPSGDEAETERRLVSAVSPFTHAKQASIRKKQATSEAFDSRRDTMGSMDSEESYKSDDESQLGVSHSVPPELYLGASSSRSSRTSFATYTPGSSPASLPDGFGIGISPLASSVQRMPSMSSVKSGVNDSKNTRPPPLGLSSFRSSSTSRGALSSESGVSSYFSSTSYTSRSQSSSSDGPAGDSSMDSGDEADHDDPRQHPHLVNIHELQPPSHSSQSQQQQLQQHHIQIPLLHTNSRAIRLPLPLPSSSPTSTSASYGSTSSSISFSPSSPSSLTGRSRSMSTPRAPSTPGSSSTPPLSPATMASEDSERPFGYGYSANSNTTTANNAASTGNSHPSSSSGSAMVSASAHRLSMLVVHSIDDEDDDDEYTMLSSHASSFGSNHALSSSVFGAVDSGHPSSSDEQRERHQQRPLQPSRSSNAMNLSEDSLSSLRLNRSPDLTSSSSITPSASSSSLGSDDSLPTLGRSSASLDSTSVSSTEPTITTPTPGITLQSAATSPSPDVATMVDLPSITRMVSGDVKTATTAEKAQAAHLPASLPSASLNSPTSSGSAAFFGNSGATTTVATSPHLFDTAIGGPSSFSSKQQRSADKKSRGKRHSGASSSSIGSSRSASLSSFGSSSAGTMESMMFGWKLNKNAKTRGGSGSAAESSAHSHQSQQFSSSSSTSYATSGSSFSYGSSSQHPAASSSPASASPAVGAADLPRKRSRSARLASPSNHIHSATGAPGSSPLPFVSPLQHPLHAGFAPPVSFGVFDPQRARSASLHSIPNQTIPAHPTSLPNLPTQPHPSLDSWTVAALQHQQHQHHQHLMAEQAAAAHAVASSSPLAFHGLPGSSPAALSSYLSVPGGMVTSPTTPPDFGASPSFYNEQAYASPPQFGNPLLPSVSPHMSRSASFDIAFFAAAAAAASQPTSSNMNPLTSPSSSASSFHPPHQYHHHHHPHGLGQLSPHHHAHLQQQQQQQQHHHLLPLSMTSHHRNPLIGSGGASSATHGHLSSSSTFSSASSSSASSATAFGSPAASLQHPFNPSFPFQHTTHQAPPSLGSAPPPLISSSAGGVSPLASGFPPVSPASSAGFLSPSSSTSSVFGSTPPTPRGALASSSASVPSAANLSSMTSTNVALNANHSTPSSSTLASFVAASSATQHSPSTKKHAVGLPGRNGTSAFQVVRRNSLAETPQPMAAQDSSPSTVVTDSASRASISHFTPAAAIDEPDSPPTPPQVKKKKKLAEV